MQGSVSAMKMLILSLLLFFPTLSEANPYLMAEPVGEADYYVISIDGEASTVSPTLDSFFFNLVDLEAGEHTIVISAGDYDNGDGEETTFIINKTSNKTWVFYTIIPDKIDSELFDNLRVKLKR